MDLSAPRCALAHRSPRSAAHFSRRDVCQASPIKDTKFPLTSPKPRRNGGRASRSLDSQSAMASSTFWPKHPASRVLEGIWLCLRCRCACGTPKGRSEDLHGDAFGKYSRPPAALAWEDTSANGSVVGMYGLDFIAAPKVWRRPKRRIRTSSAPSPLFAQSVRDLPHLTAA